MSGPNPDRPALYALIVGIAAVVFAIDVLTSLGLAEWVLYFVPLALSLSTLRAWIPVAVSFGCAALLGAGYFASPPPAVEEMRSISQINRSVAAAALIGLGFVGWRFVGSQVRIGVDDWIKAGLAGLVPRLQGEQEIQALARQVLSYLAEYLEARVGSIYVMTAPGVFTRAGALALDPESDPGAAVVRLGETLIGEAAATGRLQVIADVPEGYLRVRSGVGSARPRALVLLPMHADSWVNGLLELGFFTPLSTAARELLEQAAGPIGVALRSAEYRRRQAELLTETQRQAAELQTQQEELQATNEELEEHTNALASANSRLQAQQAELEENNAQLEEQTRTLEEQKDRLSTTQLMLQSKATELERASQYKSEFLANMSHELRTPLNSSLILARLLSDNRQGNLSPEQVQYADNIQKAGNDLLQLINDILDLAKIESGKLELEVAQVEIADLFGALEQRFAPLASEKKLALLATLEPGCPARIETDSLRLQQILSNLLSNAVKFTPQGTIRLRAEAGPGDDVVFSVQDTGIGIAPHQHEVIFEAFRQADGTTNRKYGGTGLGLSICRELADHLGGSIRLRSAEGQGSTFSVSLPLRHRSRTVAPVASAPARPAVPIAERAARSVARVEDDRGSLDGTSRVVLVVEDDPIFSGILRDLANELDFRCVIAPTADEGLRLVREVRPVAVLLDIGLPDHSGFAVLEAMKRDPSARHIPIHVLSASDDRQVAREMGVVGYAIKPVERDELLAVFRRVEQHIARRPRSVLVVEDDAVQREAIAKLLDSDGVDITPVATAADAFAKLRETSFDCVVLDLMLPETSGFELLEWMASDAGSSFPPVIVYTARALTIAEEHRLRQHARSVIIKGARSPERLLEEVTLFLHQVEADLPEEKRQMLRAALDREAVFMDRRILIVEDDVRNVFALTSALEPKGAAIEIARNGKEALRRLESEPQIDLVLMDLMMPEMDGLTAIREIRKDGRLVGLPIIALTAKAMPDDREQSLAAGANDYIAKPIDLEKLVSLIRVWMPRG